VGGEGFEPPTFAL